MDARIPAHLEVAALLRAAQAQGGFATVLAKGERHAGTILVICCERGAEQRAYERMGRADGTRAWHLARAEVPGQPQDFADFCARRQRQDRDLWIIELDCPGAEQLLHRALATD